MRIRIQEGTDTFNSRVKISLNLFKSYFILLKMEAETHFLVLIGANYSKLS